MEIAIFKSNSVNSLFMKTSKLIMTGNVTHKENDEFLSGFEDNARKSINFN
jgi:hypothetical protein